MDHFVDLDLRGDPEVAPHQVMGALCTQLHRTLSTLQSKAVGVSFPMHDASVPHLGDRLRLHGTVEALTELMSSRWLASMRDYVTASGVLPVPAGCMYCTVRRVQAKSSPERMRRRLQRRHGLTDAQALESMPDSTARHLKLPFVCVSSASTGQRFSFFFSHGKPQSDCVFGTFNTYGISATATVPWF